MAWVSFYVNKNPEQYKDVLANIVVKKDVFSLFGLKDTRFTAAAWEFQTLNVTPPQGYRSTVGTLGVIMANVVNPEETGLFGTGWFGGGWKQQSEGEPEAQDLEQWIAQASAQIQPLDIKMGQVTLQEAQQTAVERGWFVPVVLPVAGGTNTDSNADSNTDSNADSNTDISKYLPYIIAGAGVIVLAVLLKK